MTLMPSIFVAVPIDRVRPYGIFGFGFIRQRTEASEGGILLHLSDDDIGYSVGGGVIVSVRAVRGVRGICGASKCASPMASAFSG